MNQKPLRIIQCSPGRTGSTLLTNMLYGLLCPDEPVTYVAEFELRDSVVTKTHRVEIDEWISRYADTYDLYFVCSERAGIGHIDGKYHSYRNVLIVQYEELLCDQAPDVARVVHAIARKLNNGFLPPGVALDERAAVRRVDEMNERYDQIKHLPFSYHDAMYHIHGSHRGRGAFDAGGN